jgi:hypothetical protein
MDPDPIGAASFFRICTVTNSTKCKAKPYYFLENFNMATKIKVTKQTIRLALL